MKVVLSCLLLALAVGVENAPVRGASSCSGMGIDAEKAIRALASPTPPTAAPEQSQLPKYDRKQLARLFEISAADHH